MASEYWNTRAERYALENIDAAKFIITELYGMMSVRNMDDMFYDAFVLGFKELRARAEQSHDEAVL